jgi:hypothetical protein
MPDRLPPDLERVGDHLTAAAGRAVAARRQRRAALRRLSGASVAGALVFAALTPGALGPAQRTPGPFETLLARVSVTDTTVPRACDQPRGGRFSLPACEAITGGEAMVLHRPRRW